MKFLKAIKRGFSKVFQEKRQRDKGKPAPGLFPLILTAFLCPLVFNPAPEKRAYRAFYGLAVADSDSIPGRLFATFQAVSLMRSCVFITVFISENGKNRKSFCRKSCKSRFRSSSCARNFSADLPNTVLCFSRRFYREKRKKRGTDFPRKVENPFPVTRPRTASKSCNLA